MGGALSGLFCLCGGRIDKCQIVAVDFIDDEALVLFYHGNAAFDKEMNKSMESAFFLVPLFLAASRMVSQMCFDYFPF